MTFAQAKQKLAAINMTLKKNDFNEFEVNFKGGREASIYYTNDLEDAVGSGELMHLAQKNAA